MGWRCGIAIGTSEERVIWERTLFDDAHSRDVLRVVSYGAGSPVLEKRHYYLGKDNRWHSGKCRGFTGLDWAVALTVREQFETALLAPWKSGRALLGEPAGQGNDGGSSV